MAGEETYDLAPDNNAAATPPARRNAPAASHAQAAPAASPVLGAGVQGQLLQIRDGVRLPDRCIFCNGTKDLKRVSRRLSWMESDNHNASMGLLPVVGVIYKMIWLIGLVGRLNNRQHIQIEYAVCANHRMLKVVALGNVLLLLPLSIFLFVMSFVWNNVPCRVTAGVLFLIAVIVSVAASRRLAVEEVGRNGFLVRGAGKAFLQSLRAQNSVRVNRQR